MLGGWEEVLAKDLVTENVKSTLHNIPLWTKQRRTNASNVLVTDKRAFEAVRNDSIQALTNFMSSRLTFDKNLEQSISSISAFCGFSATTNDLRALHRSVCPDVDLPMLMVSKQEPQ